MDAFFEAWIETLVTQLARSMGGIVRTGRKRETLAPIHWDHPYMGTQKYLLPDVILEHEDTTYIFDAKYKRHWEEISMDSWSRQENEFQEQHRQDLLQVLAYASTKSTQRVVACLIYPCQAQTWESLQRRNLLFRRAHLPVSGRSLELLLTAVPMQAQVSLPVEHLRYVLARAL